ncbi:MAG: hypothetical protein EAZ57_11095 [Cytophagales bacterium]|nr:MAG: hypothetical protein EAZ67_11580 [Cytophagales bacterium]TAF59515.1 MAG: hypothetical protein EAZ57_11095 [Cytophagales bacterium]
MKREKYYKICNFAAYENPKTMSKVNTIIDLVSKKHFLLLGAAFIFLATACGGGASTNSTADSTVSTENADLEAAASDQIISKSITEHFEAFKKTLKPGNSVEVIKKDDANGYIEFQESWKDADGGTNYKMAVWKGDNIDDVIAVFAVDCSGGGCDFDIAGFKIYDASFNELTADYIDLPKLTKQYQDAIPEKKKMGFEGYNGFYATIPQKGTRIEFCLASAAEGNKDGGTLSIFAEYDYEYDYDKRVGRFVEVPSQYQEGIN